MSYKDEEKNSPAYIEKLWAEYCKIRGYDQGGKVKADEDDGVLNQLASTLQKAFSAPSPAPKPTPSLDEKYEKVRQQNRDINEGKKSAVDQTIYNKGGKVKGYDGGGTVQPSTPPQIDPDKAKSAQDSMRKAFGFADGGKVKKVEKVEGKDTPVNASKLESQYAPEEEAAAQSAADSTQGQIEDELNQDTSQASDSDATPSDSDDSQQADVRQLPADTISSKEAMDQDSRNPASDDMPPEAQSAAEAAASQGDTQSSGSSAIGRTVVDPGSAPAQAPASPQTSMLQRLLDAQNQRKNMLQAQQIGKGGALLAAGIAGHGAQPVSPEYFDNKALANEPVQSIEEQVALQGKDPNSDYSKALQKLAVAQLGVSAQAVAGVPGDNIAKLLPQSIVLPLKAKAAQDLADKKAHLQADVVVPSKTAGAIQVENAKEPNREKLAGVKSALKGQEKLSDMGIKADKDIDAKVLGARNALGIASRTALFADKIPTLAKQYPNLNDAPPIIVTDINQAFGNLISQGVPGQHMMDKLDSQNLPKTAAGFWQYLTANPTGADQKEIINLVLKSSQAQKELAQGQIKEYVIPTVRIRESAGLPDKDKQLLLDKYGIKPDEYNNWQKGNIIDNVVQNQTPGGAQAGGQQRMPASVAPPSNEERRQTKDGRIAIFDKNTKQFLRYDQ